MPLTLQYEIRTIQNTKLHWRVCNAEQPDVVVAIVDGVDNKEEKLRTRAPAAQRGRKSKFHSAHAHLGHLEVLHAKFHDRATSNLGD